MDAAGILPPLPFLDSPGKPSIPWSEWERRFETYITAIEGTKLSAERRKALLLHYAGAEVQRIYHNQPSIKKNEGEDETVAPLLLPASKRHRGKIQLSEENTRGRRNNRRLRSRPAGTGNSLPVSVAA